jgi:predicted DNA-binding transcriptional regulator AlpA
VKRNTLNRYKLPPPDVQVGERLFGWLPETIDAWNASRPGKGHPWINEP